MSNPTLKFAHSKGMKLIFVTRENYRKKEKEGFINQYLSNPSTYYLIPEGGTNQLALQGTQEILDERMDHFDYICVAAGTGGTAAGIIAASKAHQKVLVFPALKGDFLKEEISNLLKSLNISKKNWTLIPDYHFGGYAKWNDELIHFIKSFTHLNNFTIDPIYNGKMLYGLDNMIKNNYFRNTADIIAIHTGGTQAIVGFNEKNRVFL